MYFLSTHELLWYDQLKIRLTVKMDDKDVTNRDAGEQIILISFLLQSLVILHLVGF